MGISTVSMGIVEHDVLTIFCTTPHRGHASKDLGKYRFWRRETLNWSRCTDVLTGPRAHRVVEQTPEDLKMHIYEFLDDDAISSWNAVLQLIKVIDE